MKLSEAFGRALHLLSVPTCVSCKERLEYGQKAICPDCSRKFEEIKTRNCSRCSKVLSECSCSTDFLSAHFVKKVVKCFRYNSREESLPADSLIYSLKRDNRSDVLDKCTDELSSAIKNSINIDSSFVITNVPRRRRSIIKYGIDHSELLARGIAKRLGISYIKALKSKSKNEQKQLTREERQKNVRFVLLRKKDLKGRYVIVVDDVITSGASVAAAASLIRGLYPKAIYAASLAIAYNDDE